MAKYIVTSTIRFEGPAFKSKKQVKSEIQNMLDGYFYDNREFLGDGDSSVSIIIENIKRV